MPCFDAQDRDEYRSRHDDMSALRYQVKQLEAALCAAMHVVESHARDVNADDAMTLLDYEESGVDEKKFRSWWIAHKAKDAARRREEAIKTAALSKLTPEELKVLGIK